MGHVLRVNQATMEIIVINHVPATVKATFATFNMGRVLNASMDGRGLYVTQVRFFSYVKIMNKRPRGHVVHFCNKSYNSDRISIPE